MRAAPNLKVEHYRVTNDRRFPSSTSSGNNGAFIIPSPSATEPLFVICSDGLGWEHVSISHVKRCPTWGEMDYIKRLFWEDEETVIQIHAPRSRWVNNDPHCLHLWRSTTEALTLPDTLLVGYVGLTEQDLIKKIEERNRAAALRDVLAKESEQ